MIGAEVGSIRSGGNGPSRVSPAPPDDGDPAATRAYSSSVSTGTAAVAVPVQSAVCRRLCAESSSRTVILDELADQFGVPPLLGDGEAPARMRAETWVAQRIRASASAIACRTESTASAAGTLSSAACWSLAAAFAGSASASARRMAAEVVVEPGVLQPAVARPRIEKFPRLCGPLGRRREIAAQDVDPAALQQDAVDVQRLLHLTPMPLGMPETLVGVVELLDRQAISPKYSQHRDTSCAR